MTSPVDNFPLECHSLIKQYAEGEVVLDVVLLKAQLARVDVALCCDLGVEVVQRATRRPHAGQVGEHARVRERVANLLPAIGGGVASHGDMINLRIREPGHVQAASSEQRQ